MDRLGFLDPEDLDGKPLALYQDIIKYFDGQLNYTYKYADGRMVGPFGLELHTPGAGYAWLNMTKSLAEMKELPSLPREIAILVTGAHEKAAYELYAHAAVSRLPSSDIDQIMAGSCPARLDSKCHAAFEVATELCTRPGPLKESVWNNAVGILGKEAAIAVIHYVGFYKYVATILNGFDSQVPKEEEVHGA